MNKRKYFLAIVIIVIFITPFIFSNQEFKVARVIDGDTIKLESGEYVRLVGINAPEKGQLYYEEAKSRLEELVQGKRVVLKEDFEDRDKYGRLLRYVYVEGNLVNVQLVREGYAKPYLLQNVKHKSKIQKAWENCLKEDLNLCGLGEKCDNTCIGISYINWNAQGNDCQNLNDEYLIFKNFCNISCDLTNWRISDRGYNSYTIPNFTLEAYDKVIIYSGEGKNTKNKLYWNNSGKECNAIWNNDCEGDTVYLINPKGEIVLEYSYQGFC